MSIAFLVTAFILCLTPGTGVLYTVASGLSRGTRAGILAAVAGTIGMVPHYIAAMTGVAAVLRAHPVAFRVLTWVGAAYLVHMAWVMWRDRSTFELEDLRDEGAWQIIRKGVVMNVLNPKLTAFFFAFLPQFVPADDPSPVATLALLGGTAIAMTLVVFVGYAVAAAAARRQILSRPRVIHAVRKVFAVTFVGLAAKLAVSPA